VALKSELAGKLIERDPLAARREIDEVMRVSRDALSQVRRAVSGIRAAGLAAELASARLLLECDGVAFKYDLGDVALTPELETALALAVREAVTNIQRHARAASAHIVLRGGDGVATLVIQDDGRGGAIVPAMGWTACANASPRCAASAAWIHGRARVRGSKSSCRWRTDAPTPRTRPCSPGTDAAVRAGIRCFPPMTPDCREHR
jgi:two-component system sensor histidine kinase DesK